MLDAVLNKFVGKPNTEETRKAVVAEINRMMTKRVFKIINCKTGFKSKERTLSVNFTISCEDVKDTKGICFGVNTAPRKNGN
jgi:hypothetical protein